MRLIFGERNIVSFKNENDYYESLGYLANSSRGIRFEWEDYENKWGIEGRIWIKNSLNAPPSLQKSFSAGTPEYDHRLNCNDYLAYIIKYNSIPNGALKESHYESIKNTIPNLYLSDFETGYNR